METLHQARSVARNLGVTRWIALISCSLLLGSCRSQMLTDTSTPSSLSDLSLGSIIPLPVSVEQADGSFTLGAGAGVYVEPPTIEITGIAQYLVDKLNRSTGYDMRVVATNGPPTPGNLYFTTVGGDPSLGEEDRKSVV